MSRRLLFATVCSFFLILHASAAEEDTRLAELNAFWKEVSTAVNKGDFVSYQKTCHSDAILVSGVKKTAYPLAIAMERWEQEFEDTRSGKMTASVEFRFSHRYGDETTAHEAGMFLYTFQKEGEETNREFIHFEGLLTKKEGRWLLIMEYQKSIGTEEEWNALQPA